MFIIERNLVLSEIIELMGGTYGDKRSAMAVANTLYDTFLEFILNALNNEELKLIYDRVDYEFEYNEVDTEIRFTYIELVVKYAILVRNKSVKELGAPRYVKYMAVRDVRKSNPKDRITIDWEKTRTRITLLNYEEGNRECNQHLLDEAEPSIEAMNDYFEIIENEGKKHRKG